MYKCHLCELETKQLNGLMSRHWLKHCPGALSKEQYKRDLLIFNDRSPNNCKVCNKETTIPKGESKYPKYCRLCFIEELKNSSGKLNINWKGGKIIVNCAFCNSKIERHSSHLKRLNKFCSTSCAQRWYGVIENRTELQRANDVVQANRLRRFTKDPYHRAKLAIARSNLATTRRSKKEDACIAIIKGMHPNTAQSYLVKYYTFDAFIPELNLLIEFDGTYWHSLPKCISLDKRKNLYIARWRPDLSILRIKERDWDSALNKEIFINNQFFTVITQHSI